MNTGGDMNDALPALPRELNDKLFALLFGDPSRRENAFAELLASHQDHAETLRAQWQHHLLIEGETSAPREIGDAGAIAGYRLLEVLGEGGMGTARRAEGTGQAPRRDQADQARHGQQGRARALLARTAGARRHQRVIPLATFPFQGIGNAESVPVSIPNGCWLIGFGLHAQSFVVSPGSNAAGRTISNTICLAVGQ